MSDSPRRMRKFEVDVGRVTRMFSELVMSISDVEMDQNDRLQGVIRHAAKQVRLCRELARSLDDWSR